MHPRHVEHVDEVPPLPAILEDLGAATVRNRRPEEARQERHVVRVHVLLAQPLALPEAQLGPRHAAVIAPDRGVRIAGADDNTALQYSLDDGPWQEADLADVTGPDTWRQWHLRWDATGGDHTLIQDTALRSQGPLFEAPVSQFQHT